MGIKNMAAVESTGIRNGKMTKRSMKNMKDVRGCLFSPSTFTNEGKKEDEG